MAEEQQQQGNVKQEFNSANTGMNMDLTVNQIPKGVLTYALNASVENYDSNSVNYQNEPGNEFCLKFPEGYQLIGEHFIQEKNKHIFFLTNPETGDSQIGYMDNNDCIYRIYVNSKCLNFNIHYPIHKAVHKISNCSTEIYWTDGFNPRRYLDIENIPYKKDDNSNPCDPKYLNEVDCNQLKIQPNFLIPNLSIADVTTGGDLKAGTYQFAIQYANANGIGYSSFYSVTNPTPIANTQITTLNFDYQVGKSIVIDITNLDTTGYFNYFNVAVIKTINAISSVELIGTYFIDKANKQLTYTGQSKTDIRLSLNDIFEKYPYYEIAQDLTAVQDILVWDNLTSIDRINYQKIANQITLEWQTYRIPNTENYSDELNATNLRGYLRDEVYAFEIVFLLKNGKQTDGFHIPGKVLSAYEASLPLIPYTNPDFIGEPTVTINGVGYSPYWKIYNTATVEGYSPKYIPNDPTYKGEYQYGQFAYWESIETYPCDTKVWGDLANQPIRHHKFPDVLVSPIFETPTLTYNPDGTYAPVMQNDAIFPIGVKIDNQQVLRLIESSSLTQEQKDNIAGFKIIRGDRSTNKSIVAKGILRNVGKYKREETEYYYPNYPYNDLSVDPFLLDKSNSYTVDSTIAAQSSNSSGVCRSFHIVVIESGSIQYIDCNTNVITSKTIVAGEEYDFCANNIPTVITGKAILSSNTYTIYRIKARNAFFNYISPAWGCRNYFTNGSLISPPLGYSSWNAYCLDHPTDGCCNPALIQRTKLVSTVSTSGQLSNQWTYLPSLTYPTFASGDPNYVIEVYQEVGYGTCSPNSLNGFIDETSKYRQIFNSPETSFGQPFLGNILKLESAIFGAGKAHFTQVKKNAMYKLITREAQQDALASAKDIADTTLAGFDAAVFFAAYQAYLTIYINGITRRNYAYSFNSIGSYDYNASIGNNLQIKQRELDLAQYLIPGVQSVGDKINVNNYQRESSVFLKTAEKRYNTTYSPLPYPKDTPSLISSGGTNLIQDNSRFIASTTGRGDCNNPGKDVGINLVSYYASLKNTFINQWGQIYSYEVVDTGYEKNLSDIGNNYSTSTIFGGDTYISRFAFKTKLPFFIDNRVGAPDDSDIYYDEIGNVAFPKYWHSARSVLSNATISAYSRTVTLTNFISIKAHNFDCPNSQTPNSAAQPNPGRTYYDGRMYLFAYGIPSFYCESSYNVDLRQAFNNKEGDFWPHVSTGIPDDWVQESFVTIAQDNTYYYNPTFSKQNKENFFSHLPLDWSEDKCLTYFPFRAIYSDAQESDPTNKVNNWLNYSATSFFDFPQNYGKLTSLDGIQNKAVLARFENKSLLYNTMLTINTSNPQAAYLGNSTLFKSSPPIDFAETDLGYVGSQHKMLLKIPQGQITIDAKRGQVFLISGNQAQDLSAFGSGMNRFFTDHLAFEILRWFPNVDVDNHFNGIGLHGVYDSKFDRVIITKLDYIPLSNNIKYDEVNREFYIEEKLLTDPNTSTYTTIRSQVYVTDKDYFCNKSWTLSFNMNTKSWISFHSYIPNYYIAENNFFYSGLNDCCTEIDAAANSFKASVGIVGRPAPTTTTTTSSTTFTTTSTTTIAPFDCGLEGDAIEKVCTLEGTAEEQYCALQGTAEPISTTTTTTTSVIVYE